MKKTLFSICILLILVVVFSSSVSAQAMMGFSGLSPDNAAIQNQQQEEQEGKQLLDSLNSKTVTCSELRDADFEKIGEYFMGQSIGNTSRHIAMNEMMKSMMGEQGEEQMHVAWGKRGSGCDTGTKGGGNPMMGYGWNNMMGLGGFSLLGWIPMLIFWVLLILGVIALFRYLIGGFSKENKTPLDMLKERYAKGEVNKKEFEEMKKDLR